MTESITSGKRRGSERRHRRMLGSIMRGASLASRDTTALPSAKGALSLKASPHRLLAVCGVLAPLVVLVLVVVGAVVTPGYNYISAPISQLSAIGSPNPQWMTAGFIAYGLLIIGFGFALGWSVKNHRWAGLVRLLLIIHGIGFMLGGVFPDDLRTAEVMTTIGILHNVFIIIGCTTFVFGILIFAVITYADPTWRGLVRFSIGVLVVSLITFGVAQIPALASVEGMMQRVYVTLSMILVEVIAVRLIFLRPPEVSAGEMPGT